jgi:hypothetical protein
MADQAVRALCLVDRLVAAHRHGLKQHYYDTYANAAYSYKCWEHFVQIPSVVSLVRQMVSDLSPADTATLIDVKPALQKEVRGGLYPNEKRMGTKPLRVVHYAGDKHGHYPVDDVGRAFARLASYCLFRQLFPEQEPVFLLDGRWFKFSQDALGIEEME